MTTGLVQAPSTHWGSFRHCWVVAKLLLTTASIPILLTHMQATTKLSALASVTASDALFAAALSGLRGELVERSAEATLVLLAVIALAVYKPAGTTHHRGG